MSANNWAQWKRAGLAAAAILSAVAGAAAFQEPGSEEGFFPLFNGSDLKGWKGDPRFWKAEEGQIIGSSDGHDLRSNTFLIYEKPFSDFILRLSVKLRNGNSGVQFRSEETGEFVVAGYQADVAEAVYFGMLYEERKRGFMDYWKQMTPEQQAAVHALARPGEWNDYEITCRGPSITLKLNGTVTCRIEDPDGARSGIIALQVHAGPPMRVAFRNIRLKELN